MNMNNMEAVFKIMEGWNTFKKNHPKFPMFLNAVKNTGINEGTVIEIKLTSPEGKVMETNLKVTAEDIELFNSLKGMRM